MLAETIGVTPITSSTTSSTTSPTTSLATSLAASLTAPLASSPTSTPTTSFQTSTGIPTTSSQGLPTAAKAGIGVGVGIAALLIIASILALWVFPRRRLEQNAEAEFTKSESTWPSHGGMSEPQDPIAELRGTSGGEIAELEGRAGLAEIGNGRLVNMI
ncbi:MAG: hypothetical protein M1813_000507 [Trichoglossum hirsutum]|nr:MAG: hypothetical protein M1813_000507 [Trichoglossum hirsutum]